MELTNYARKMIAGNLIASVSSGSFSGVLKVAKVGLFTGSPTLNRDSVLADLTEATFDGYAQASPTFGAAYNQADGDVAMVGTPAAFVATGSTHPEVITGAFLTDGATTPKLLGYERFPTGIPILHTDDGITFPPVVTIPASNWGNLTPLI